MSIIKRVVDPTGEIDLAALNRFLLECESKISNWREDLSLSGKNLRDCLADQASIAAYYDELKVGLYAITEYIDILIARRSGEINIMFKESSRFDHSDASIRLLTGKDEKIIEYKKMRLDVKELYDRIHVICNQFDKRGYTLTNITKIVVVGLDDITLTPEDEHR